jgi:hypothetical protein
MNSCSSRLGASAVRRSPGGRTPTRLRGVGAKVGSDATNARIPTGGELEVIRVRERYRLGRWITTFLGSCACIAVLWVPLQGVRPMVDALAGKQTTAHFFATATVSIGVALSAALTSCFGV